MPWKDTQRSRLRRLFMEGFTAVDIAEPLVSFDAGADARQVQELMVEHDFDLVGIRQQGLVTGYARRKDLESGTCLEHLCPFIPGSDLVPESTSLPGVVKALSSHQHCFVTILGHPGAIIMLSDLEKPPMRMFLFGMITLSEMLMTEILRKRYGNGSWREMISAERLGLAERLQEERRRRGQNVDLIDCLQYGDKGGIIMQDEDIRKALGQESRSQAKRAVKEMEMLRNNLAHSQRIIPDGWHRIVIACSRFEANLQAISEQSNLITDLPSIQSLEE